MNIDEKIKNNWYLEQEELQTLIKRYKIMKYLNYVFGAIIIFLLVSCSTQPTNCDTYTLEEHRYYMGDGYSLFVNNSDSITVFFEKDLVPKYNEGQKYEVCFTDNGVIVN